MTPAPISKGSAVSTTPEHFQNDSGFYGSGQKTAGKTCNIQYGERACFYHSGSLQKKRKLDKTTEDEFASVKRILFQPYSSKELTQNKNFQSFPFGQDSTNQMSRGSRIKQAMRSQYTQVIDDLKQCSIEAKIFRCEPTPIYPEYSPMKFNFQPLKANNLASQSSCSIKQLENWGPSLNLPEYKCDILKKLTDRRMWLPITSILSHLTTEDLHAASCVSRCWCKIVGQDRQASSRLGGFMKEKCIRKENKIRTEINSNQSCGSLLLDVTNKVNEHSEQPLDSHTFKTRYEYFVEAAKNIENSEVLMKCPNCQYPAKKVHGSKYECTRELCRHKFCNECSGPYLQAHLCPSLLPSITIPNVVVGSRKSKKNLKRL